VGEDAPGFGVVGEDAPGFGAVGEDAETEEDLPEAENDPP
jgi:hypothetical protein